MYLVSSSSLERWCSGANFTIGAFQDISILYVSDNVAAVSGEYDTQTDFDIVFYQHSGGTTGPHTGPGVFSGPQAAMQCFMVEEHNAPQWRQERRTATLMHYCRALCKHPGRRSLWVARRLYIRGICCS
jgi:hypothetical protein